MSAREPLVARVVDQLRRRPALPSLSEREASERCRPHGTVDRISPLTRRAPQLSTAGGTRSEQAFDGAELTR